MPCSRNLTLTIIITITVDWEFEFQTIYNTPNNCILRSHHSLTLLPWKLITGNLNLSCCLFLKILAKILAHSFSHVVRPSPHKYSMVLHKKSHVVPFHKYCSIQLSQILTGFPAGGLITWLLLLLRFLVLCGTFCGTQCVHTVQCLPKITSQFSRCMQSGSSGLARLICS